MGGLAQGNCGIQSKIKAEVIKQAIVNWLKPKAGHFIIHFIKSGFISWLNQLLITGNQSIAEIKLIQTRILIETEWMKWWPASNTSKN